MTSRVITLDDGWKITDIICDKCGNHLQITSDICVTLGCSCGERHLNIAYFEINKEG